MNEKFQIDFVGIGASKSGTTWLAHILAEHPEVCMSEPKEVHFFNDRLTFRNTIHERNYAKGISWYKKHFMHCATGKIKGDITPRYSTDAIAAERIFQHNPHIKILYCFRHPIDRLESHYNFAKYYVGKEDRSIDEAIRNEPEYLDMTRYGSNLEMYLNYFKLEQFCFIWFDDILQEPKSVLHQVYSFLGVDPTFIPPSLYTKSNPARASKSIGVELFIRKLNYKLIAWGFSRIVHIIKRSPLKNWMMRINSRPLQKEKMTDDTKQFVVEALRNDIIKLEKLTGRNLSHWLKTN